MSFVAVAIGGAAVVGAGASIYSANKAADGQEKAASNANATQKSMFNQQRKDHEPYRNAGNWAVGAMKDSDFQRDFTASDFRADPGYDFRMSEGQKALERSAAARGGLQSGGTLKALTKYSQGVASDEYQNAYNRFNQDRDRRFGRLSGIAGLGQASAANSAAAAQNYANQYGANVTGAANASGAAGIASANAINSSLSGIAQAGMDMHSMNQQKSWMDQWQAKQAANNYFK